MLIQANVLKNWKMLPSHGRGRWFEPSIAHSEKIERQTINIKGSRFGYCEYPTDPFPLRGCRFIPGRLEWGREREKSCERLPFIAVL